MGPTDAYTSLLFQKSGIRASLAVHWPGFVDPGGGTAGQGISGDWADICLPRTGAILPFDHIALSIPP
jgi:hypothetical protein